MTENSRNAELLLDIINGESYDGEPQSRNEAILLSILDGTEYTEEPQSRIEELLLELKENSGGGKLERITAISEFTITGGTEE